MGKRNSLTDKLRGKKALEMAPGTIARRMLPKAVRPKCILSMGMFSGDGL